MLWSSLKELKRKKFSHVATEIWWKVINFAKNKSWFKAQKKQNLNNVQQFSRFFKWFITVWKKTFKKVQGFSILISRSNPWNYFEQIFDILTIKQFVIKLIFLFHNDLSKWKQQTVNSVLNFTLILNYFEILLHKASDQWTCLVFHRLD